MRDEFEIGLGLTLHIDRDKVAALGLNLQTVGSDLAAQTGRQYPSGVPAVQGLAAGEGAITLPTIVPQVEAVKSKGAPVDSIMPAYTTGIEQGVAGMRIGIVREGFGKQCEQ
mgnify:CR=1 FL=1